VAQPRLARPIAALHALPWRQLLLAFALGAAMPFAFSPHEFKPLAILALAGALHLARRQAPWATGFAFGLGWFGLGAWWLAVTLHTYGPVVWPIAVLAVLLLGAMLALFPALWCGLSLRFAGRGAPLLLVFPAVVALLEWLRGCFLTGLPWTSLGTLLLDTPAIGWGAVVGVYGAALLPALFAAALALLADKPTRQPAAIALGVALLLFVLAPSPYAADGPAQKVALIQANIPEDRKWDTAFLLETLRRYRSLSTAAATEADLLLWPEASLPFFLEEHPEWDQWLADLLAGWQRPLLYGGLKLGPQGEATNGLFLATPGDARTAAARPFVGKRHLVPFGEYVPEWLPFIRTLGPGVGDFRPVNGGPLLLTQGDNRFGPLICYEALFPEEARARVAAGANVLVTVTNDAWYDRSPAAWQHLQGARMRAVESGRYLLRAANTGVSAIVAPDGRIEATMPWWQQGSVVGEFRTASSMTPYSRFGDWPMAGLAVTLLLIGYGLRRGVGSTTEGTEDTEK